MGNRNGVTQGSLVGPLLLCFFINDLTESLKFNDPFTFPDDSKTLAIAKRKEVIQSDLNAISNWVDTNGMRSKPDKCNKFDFRGTDMEDIVGIIRFEDQKDASDMGFTLREELT